MSSSILIFWAFALAIILSALYNGKLRRDRAVLLLTPELVQIRDVLIAARDSGAAQAKDKIAYLVEFIDDEIFRKA